MPHIKCNSYEHTQQPSSNAENWAIVNVTCLLRVINTDGIIK